jgi:tetratricopeptide (TPR) repeat protein
MFGNDTRRTCTINGASATRSSSSALPKTWDPLSVMTNWQMANELFYSGQYDAAMAQANHTLEIDPSHAWSFRTLGQCLEAVGKLDEAIAAYLKAGQVALGHLGRAYALAGRRAEARELVETLIRQPVDGTGHNGVQIAFILTGLGEHAKASEWLERTQRDGVRMPFSLRVEPQWDAVRASRSSTGSSKRNDVSGS